MGSNVKTLIKHKELPKTLDNDALTNPIAMKLDTMANVLNLMPVFAKSGKLKNKLATVSQHEIAAVHIICPASMGCEDMNCKPFALAQDTHSRDIPKVTLIKGTTIYKKVLFYQENAAIVMPTIMLIMKALIKHQAEETKFI